MREQVLAEDRRYRQHIEKRGIKKHREWLGLERAKGIHDKTRHEQHYGRRAANGGAGAGWGWKGRGTLLWRAPGDRRQEVAASPLLPEARVRHRHAFLLPSGGEGSHLCFSFRAPGVKSQAICELWTEAPARNKSV